MYMLHIKRAQHCGYFLSHINNLCVETWNIRGSSPACFALYGLKGARIRIVNTRVQSIHFRDETF